MEFEIVAAIMQRGLGDDIVSGIFLDISRNLLLEIMYAHITTSFSEIMKCFFSYFRPFRHFQLVLQKMRSHFNIVYRLPFTYIKQCVKLQ